jgi:3-oxoacyl-[acyl-carrier protein] reductase
VHSRVLFNSIAPGPIDTRLNDTLSDEWKAWKAGSLPLRRIGRPEEIAPSAVLLASADGDFYVGQNAASEWRRRHAVIFP